MDDAPMSTEHIAGLVEVSRVVRDALGRGRNASRVMPAGYAEAAAIVSLGTEALRLHALLARVVRRERGAPHGHQRSGVWNASNGPLRASQPCARCHDFADARTALGLPRWEVCAEPDEDLTACDGCGCGGVR